MPKAKPYPDSDEEEKTTNESQWEDEASTTVEQGDVAQKIRDLAEPPRRNITNITNTGANSVDESTVDDQNAHPLLTHTPVSRDTPVRAHLVVTQGNEAGQEVVLVPGKVSTIGRATDNDFVLTDIAVSRKHFDLRNDDGAWVIVDRGSGNGTVVNGNIEDNPFMLANGDLIEIGNTVFRFEDPNGPARRVSAAYQMEGDEEEMSTVAGKPMRQNVDEPPTFEAPQMLRERARPERPKTLPPPTPIRPHSPSGQPYRHIAPTQPPASTLPMPQMANRAPGPLAPSAAPGAPTMLGVEAMHAGMPLPGVMPTTMPGQGVPPHVTPGRAMQMYPMAAEIPPHSVHAQMLKITANAGRMDPSTAHVAPTPYAMAMQPPPQVASFSVAQPMSKRAKYAIGAAALSVLAAVSTIAIMKSSSGKPGTAAAAATASAGSALGTPSLKVEPVRIAAAPAPPPVAEAPKVAPEPPKPTPAPPEPAKVAPEPPKPAPAPPQEPAKKGAAKQSPKRPTPTPTREEVRAAPTPAPTRESPPKRDLSDVFKQANAAYAAKKFQEAESILSTAAKTASREDASKLVHQADNIEQFVRAYNTGMAPGGTPAVQFDKLRIARNLDNALGRAFNGDIETKLKEVSPKAAMGFMGQHDYEKALSAVQTAESAGSTDANLATARGGLNREANKLYAEAAAKADSDPKTAREDLRKLKTFIDKKMPVYDKADKLLKQLDK